jgi:hypothetical protein
MKRYGPNIIFYLQVRRRCPVAIPSFLLLTLWV